MLDDGAPVPDARARTVDGGDGPASWGLNESSHDNAAGWALVQRDWSARVVCAEGCVRAWPRWIAAAFAGVCRRVRRLCALRTLGRR